MSIFDREKLTAVVHATAKKLIRQGHPEEIVREFEDGFVLWSEDEEDRRLLDWKPTPDECYKQGEEGIVHRTLAKDLFDAMTVQLK